MLAPSPVENHSVENSVLLDLSPWSGGTFVALGGCPVYLMHLLGLSF